jgi:hypothetical protein
MLVAVSTLAIAVLAVAIGTWLGLRLVKGSDLKSDQPRLRKITIGIWISAVVAAGAWITSDGQLSFANASFGFVVASIAIFAAFRRPKDS